MRAGRCICLFLILYHIFFILSNRSALHFTGNYNAYDESLELGKKSHMVGPVGNTELGGRWRRVHHLQVAYEEAIASSSHFRESAAPYRLARSWRKIAYGVYRSEIRPFAVVRGPINPNL